MAVQPDQLQLFAGKDLPNGQAGLPVINPQAELAVVDRREHEFVGVRLDAGLDAQGYTHGLSAFLRDVRQGADFLVAVDHDAAHAVFDGHLQLVRRFVVAVEYDALPGKAAFFAVYSSPPETTSIPSPSCSTMR